MEHLKPRDFDGYFRLIARVLDVRGRGLVHAIGCNAAVRRHDPFIQKYIFPGSCQPRLSEMAGCLERNSLPILDVENMARHYAHTAQRWLENFRDNRSRIDPVRYDERFCRMWEYYLCAGVAAAWASASALYQVLFCKDPAGPIALHRV
jgi:cyclopropane-fatty-acyl-phospholipid synthase